MSLATEARFGSAGYMVQLNKRSGHNSGYSLTNNVVVEKFESSENEAIDLLWKVEC